MTARSVAHAASVACVSERSLRRWLVKPEFKAALAAAESEVLDAATRRLSGAAHQAIDTLIELLTGAESDSVKERAADSCLAHMWKLKELQDFETRLAALEEAQRKKE